MASRFSVPGGFVCAIALVLVAGGCGGGTSGHGASSAPIPGHTERVSFNASRADYRATGENFLDAAIKSSQWAMAMSDLVIANGQRKDVRDVAMSIRKREEAILAVLTTERNRLLVESPMPDYHSDPTMDLDEQQLRGLTGPDADEFYVNRMIAERRVVSQFAITAEPQIVDSKIRYLASRLPEERNRDIRELRAVEIEDLNVPRNAQAGTRYPGWQGYGRSRGGRY